MLQSGHILQTGHHTLHVLDKLYCRSWIKQYIKARSKKQRLKSARDEHGRHYQQDGVGRGHTSTYHEGPQNTSAQEGNVVVDIRRVASPQRVTIYRPRSGCYITRGHVKSNIDGADNQGLQHKDQLT